MGAAHQERDNAKKLRALKARHITAMGAAHRERDNAIKHRALNGRYITAMGVAHRERDNAKKLRALKGRKQRNHVSTTSQKNSNFILMGQSLVKNYLHIIFSTKNRKPWIHPPIESELHSYLGGICNNLDSQVIKVGGYTDHIHILCLLSKIIALITLLEKLKSHSSKWIKTKGFEYNDFYWQDGYGALSVNPSEVDIVVNYIANQKEHHCKKTFQEKYRAFLKKYNVEYDERYVWG